MLETLGEFKIKRKLGEGGMGTVYLAYQESLDRDVALKVLRQKLCDNETFIARFRREARSAASITHPNVIQIHSIGEDNGIHYFVMEYVRGEDLIQMMRGGRKFTVEETIDIVMQSAAAIACASDAGIIHRDIKPANIMLTEEGFVKVTDFGLAKSVSSEEGMTEAGTIVGTANYMSPEQGLGKDLDVRTDIYSLGVVFFELLAGRPPFRADHPSSVLYMHIHEPRPVPSFYNKTIPAVVDRMVQRMMAIAPEDRPDTARQLMDELRGLKQSLGPTNRAAESTYLMLDRPSSSSRVLPKEMPQEIPEDVPSGGSAVVSSSSVALVADDVPSVRRLYTKVLSSLGFTVKEASDGNELLTMWKQETPQVVLLDLNMPHRDGFSVLEKKQELKLSGHVIVISAHKEKEAIQTVARLGVSSYLTKPVRLEDLRNRILKIIAISQSESATQAAAEKRSPSSGAVPPVSDASSRTSSRSYAQAASASSANAAPVAGQGSGSAGAGGADRPMFVSVVYSVSPYSTELFRGILEDEGHCVACASSTHEVTKILEEDVPDLLVASISGHDAASISLIEWVQAKKLPVPIVMVLEENDADLLKKMQDKHLGAVLTKPVHLDQFRASVLDAICNKNKREPDRYRSNTFQQVVKRQSEREQNYTMEDFAHDLILTLKPDLRKTMEQRLLGDNAAKEAQTVTGQLLLKMKKDGQEELMLRYVKNAYVKGKFETRWFCMVALSELADHKVEIDLLVKILADQDYRIRCHALERLGELQAAEQVATIVRFLNDEVWKTRKSAATALERFELADVIEPLVQFYGRSRQPLPDSIRNRVLQKTGSQEIDLLEKLARSSGIEVRVFVADLLAQVGSKLSARLMVQLMKDRTPMVRAAAARAAGRVRTIRMREELVKLLVDPNSEVQKAVIEALLQYELTPGGRVFLWAVGIRGRRISEDAVAMFETIDSKPDSLKRVLTELWQQKEGARKYLSLLLEHLYTKPETLTQIVRDLNSPKGTERKMAIDFVLDAVAGASRDIADRIASGTGLHSQSRISRGDGS